MQTERDWTWMWGVLALMAMLFFGPAVLGAQASTTCQFQGIPVEGASTQETIRWGYKCPYTPAERFHIYRGAGRDGSLELVAATADGMTLRWNDPVYFPVGGTGPYFRYMVAMVEGGVETFGSTVFYTGMPRQEVITVMSPLPYVAGSQMTVQVANIMNPTDVDKLMLYPLHGTTPLVDIYAQNCSPTAVPPQPWVDTVSCTLALPALATGERYEWRYGQHGTPLVTTELFRWVP